MVVVIIAGSTAWSCTLHHWADHLRPPPLARYDAHPSPDGSNASSCVAQKDTRRQQLLRRRRPLLPRQLTTHSTSSTECDWLVQFAGLELVSLQ